MDQRPGHGLAPPETREGACESVLLAGVYEQETQASQAPLQLWCHSEGADEVWAVLPRVLKSPSRSIAGD